MTSEAFSYILPINLKQFKVWNIGFRVDAPRLIRKFWYFKHFLVWQKKNNWIKDEKIHAGI